MVLNTGRIVAGGVLAMLLLATTSPAEAQGVGLYGGLSIDPDQGYVGTFFETKAIVGQLHFRPGVDGGFGDNVTLAAINFDFIFKIPLQQSGWTLYQGSGPTIDIYRFDFAGQDEVDLTAGASFIFGIEHRNGFFVELKAGAGNNANLKIGAGFKIR
jgi:hypothetical protein